MRLQNKNKEFKLYEHVRKQGDSHLVLSQIYSSKFRIFGSFGFGRKYEVRNGEIFRTWLEEVRFWVTNSKFGKFDLSKFWRVRSSENFGFNSTFSSSNDDNVIIYIFCFHKKRILFLIIFF